ncbi:L-ascorbate oxidase-like [Phragmites australis]|uniref:L-ascorbate oxidase-like n=1 Tax=Phragmites australis TaxID=29695 RepID=UPI002D7A362F|nr:L-ascorbate oxidase-like [Phragmites australis]
MIAKPCGSLAVQLLICCTLMLVFADPVAPAPAPAPAPTTRSFRWDVEYIMWAPDCQQSVMIGINGKFPGPTITANAGDRISVEVTNSLHTEGLVIHWHGIKQIGTPWADGTASISQCPINPGETFTYEFVADKPGTFFYHGHFGMQRAAGLYGSLIVNGTDEQKEPFADEYDGELNMLLSDWYHENVYAQAAGLDGKDKHWQWVGEPQTLLINGRGQFDCSLGINRDRRACDRRKTDAFCKEEDKSERCELIRRSECGPFCEASQCAPVVFDVQPGKTYRVRIASTTSLSALNVQVQGHKLTVVEADGNFVAPFDVDDIDIYSGESYSVLLKTDQRQLPYWISVGVRGRKPKTLNALAILNYTNSKSGWPAGVPPATPAWDNVTRSKEFTYKIKARAGTVRPPEAVDRRIVMLNTQNWVKGHIKWAINHVTLSLPATPYLGAYYYGIEAIAFDATAESPDTYDQSYDIEKPPDAQAPEAQSPTAVSDRVYRITHGTVVDVVLQNANALEKGVSESHPWHLHGHDFWVLGYGDGLYNHDRDSKALDTESPPLRNTVVLFPHGWTVLRFVADNPGVWAFHCHIEPHLHMGMGVIFAEGMEKLRELNVPREAMMCGQATKAVVPLAPAMAPSPPSP